MKLQTKLALTSLAVLGGFLSLSGVVLNEAFDANIRASADAEMRMVVYGLLGSAESTPAGMTFPAPLAEPRLSQPGSGLEARLLDAAGEALWRSPSSVTLPGDARAVAQPVTPGTFVFADRGQTFELAYGFVWEEAQDRAYSLHVTIDAAPYRLRQDAFREALVAGLGLSALVFLAVQFLVLVRALAPIRKMSESIGAIESGRRDRLGEGYPPELLGLARRLDAYIDHEREMQRRYRSAVDDLAHSLKTPLSVLQTEVDAQGSGSREVMCSALAQMRQLVNDRLARVRIMPALRASSEVVPVVERLFNVMERLHPGKEGVCDLLPGAEVRVAESDLMELLGSVLENAFRFSTRQVLVESSIEAPGVLRVHDDGPGIPEADRQRVLARGARADTAHAGEGLGLSIALDIVRAYGGELTIETSRLGGALVELTLPT